MTGSIETEHNGDNYGDSSENSKATGMFTGGLCNVMNFILRLKQVALLK